MANGERIVRATPTTDKPLADNKVEYLDGVQTELTYTLKVPFRLNGQEYREVTVRRLTGREIAAISGATRQGIAPEIAMWSAMMRLPAIVVEAIVSSDIQEISELAANFTPQSAPEADGATGETGENTPQT